MTMVRDEGRRGPAMRRPVAIESRILLQSLQLDSEDLMRTGSRRCGEPGNSILLVCWGSRSHHAPFADPPAMMGKSRRKVEGGFDAP